MTEPRPPRASSASLRTQGIGKEFAGVWVLEDIHLDLLPGEVHALVGENGAGKSTFVKVLSGVHQPSTGMIIMNGSPIRVASPRVAQQHGIVLIHQEPLSFPHLSVAENIFLGHMKGHGLSGVGWRDMRQRGRALLDRLGVHLSETAQMGGLSIADQQMVEIASALSQDARVIIMDEPTAALTPVETETLFRIIRQLRGEGRTVIFISHRLEEVRGIADRVTILRDGRHVHTSAIEAVNDDDIIRYMIGRPLKEYIHKETGSIGGVMLRVHDLSLDRIFQNVSFELRAGEIVGMAGLVGAGRTDVAKAIFGATPSTSGSIEVAGHPVIIRSPADAIRHGIAYVPEDRAEMGIFRDLSVEQNVTAAIPDRIARGGVLKPAKERELVEEYVAKLSIRLASIRQPIGELSGGNQQKAILARWLLTNPKILILDEPTRGIDVGVKAEVYDIMNRLAQAGTAILLISSELTEVLTLSDRILVMSEGALTAELSREMATQEAVMRAAVPRSARAA